MVRRSFTPSAVALSPPSTPLLRRRKGGYPVTASALGESEDQYAVLAAWVAEVVTPADLLLDIGAGDGDDEYSPLIQPLVGRFVGVDPDGRSQRNPALDEWHATSVESFVAHLETGDAEDDEEKRRPRFDVALAVYVAEHVADPVAFLSAARACLRPGGSLFLVTPNLWHYFGLAAKTTMALGIDVRLLDLLRRRQHEHGHAHSHIAHFPIAYKMNSVRSMARAAQEAGFSAMEVRHLENPAVFETYFPGRLVAIPRTYARVVHRIGLRAGFGTLICRLVN